MFGIFPSKGLTHVWDTGTEKLGRSPTILRHGQGKGKEEVEILV